MLAQAGPGPKQTSDLIYHACESPFSFMNLNQLFRLLSPFSSLLLLGCVTPFPPLKMYDGPILPDSQVASVFPGELPYANTSLFAVLVGVDGRPCPGPATYSPGLPDNACENNTLIAAGQRELQIVVQTANKIDIFGPTYQNSTWRWPKFTAGPFNVEAGSLYKVMPVLTEKGLTARLELLCKATDFQKSLVNRVAKEPCV